MNANGQELSPDDPKITAYALNELSAAERVEVGSEIARSLDLRTAVNEIRAAAEMLKGELAREARETERGIKADELFSTNFRASAAVPFPRRTVAFTTALPAMAAAIMAALVWLWPNQSDRNANPAGVARSMEQKEQPKPSNNPGAAEARITKDIARGEQNWRTAFYDTRNGYYHPDDFNAGRETALEIGFRLNVPCPGPLQCDYGIPVRDLTGLSDNGRFNFSVSYQREL
jgi:hypothetical protein